MVNKNKVNYKQEDTKVVVTNNIEFEKNSIIKNNINMNKKCDPNNKELEYLKKLIDSPVIKNDPSFKFIDLGNPPCRASSNKKLPIKSSSNDKLGKKFPRRISPGLKNSDNNINTVNEFLERQKFNEYNKKQKLEYLSITNKKQYSPKINEKSQEMAKKMGDFFTRINNDVVKRSLSSKKNGCEEMFKPHINNYKPKPNPFPDFSFKIKREEKKEDPTFKPMLNKPKEYEGVRSKLQIQNNLET